MSAREAHVDGHVPISPVMVRDPTHHAASLGDPMVLAHLTSYRYALSPASRRFPPLLGDRILLFLSQAFTQPHTGGEVPSPKIFTDSRRDVSIIRYNSGTQEAQLVRGELIFELDQDHTTLLSGVGLFALLSQEQKIVARDASGAVGEWRRLHGSA